MSDRDRENGKKRAHTARWAQSINIERTLTKLTDNFASLLLFSPLTNAKHVNGKHGIMQSKKCNTFQLLINRLCYANAMLCYVAINCWTMNPCHFFSIDNVDINTKKSVELFLFWFTKHELIMISFRKIENFTIGWCNMHLHPIYLHFQLSLSHTFRQVWWSCDVKMVCLAKGNTPVS